MYLYLGGNSMVKNQNIIGIFDMDQTTVSEKTRHFLNIAQKKGSIKETSFELPKSFVVCSDGKKNTVYISQISAQTLLKRANAGSSQLQEPGAFGK